MEVPDGRLKKVEGRTLPLMVPTNVTAGKLLKAVTARYRRHLKQLTSWKVTSCSIQIKLLQTPFLGVQSLLYLTGTRKNLENLFPSCTSGCLVQETWIILMQILILIAVSQDHHFLLIQALQWRSHRKEGSHKSSLMAPPVMLLMQRLSTLLEETVPVQTVLGYFLWRKLNHMLTSLQTLRLTLWESFTQ